MAGPQYISNFGAPSNWYRPSGGTSGRARNTVAERMAAARGTAPRRRRSTTGTAGATQWQLPAMGLVNLMQQGAQQMQQESNIPWEAAQKLLNNPGMTEQEANLLKSREYDAITAAEQSGRERMGKLPTGLGATGEAMRELAETASGQRRGAARDIDIAKLASGREGTAQAIQLLNDIVEQRTQSQMTQNQAYQALLSQVAAGDMPPDLLQFVQWLVMSGGYGGGTGGGFSPRRINPATGNPIM